MNIDIDDITNICRDLKAKGWLESVRTTGKFTGGAGQTFEYHTIGRLGDSSTEADYNGIEFKTSLDVSTARVTLFTKSPYGHSIRDLWELAGYPCEDGKIRLYKQIKYGDNEGFYFRPEKDRLCIRHSDLEIDSHYLLEDIKSSLQTKLKTMLLAKYDKNSDQYRFTEFEIFHDASVENFLTMLESGEIVCEIRCSGKPNGKFKDRGTAFRISKNKLVDLYANRIYV